MVCSPLLCSLLLDNERWKQAEVPAEFQDLVNAIADGRITLPERKIPGKLAAHLAALSMDLLRVGLVVSQDRRTGSLQTSCWWMVRSLLWSGTCLPEPAVRTWISHSHALLLPQDGPAAHPDLPGVLSVRQRHPIHRHRHADAPVGPAEGQCCRRCCCGELILKLLLSFCSTLTRGAASWSWEPERCRWWG